MLACLKVKNRIRLKQRLSRHKNVPYETTRFLDNGTKVDLTIIPFEVGNNNFKVSFLDMNGKPIDVQSAERKYSQTEKSIGPITVEFFF